MIAAYAALGVAVVGGLVLARWWIVPLAAAILTVDLIIYFATYPDDRAPADYGQLSAVIGVIGVMLVAAVAVGLGTLLRRALTAAAARRVSRAARPGGRRTT